MTRRDRKRLAALGLAVIGILMALAFTAGVASAQTQEPFAQPRCWPSEIGGTGKGFMSKKFANGVCRAGFWCPKPDGTWATYTHCTLNEYDTGVLPPLLGASSPTSAISAAIAAGQVTPPADRVTDYNALHLAMRAALEAVRPPDKAWVVDAATAADGTRPAFALVNGVRSTTSTARAASGQPCAVFMAQAPSGTAGKIFAAFGPDFRRDLVALCR